MRLACFAAALSLAAPLAAQAQDGEGEAAGSEPAWSLSLSGGASLPDEGSSETFQQVGVTRAIGAGYVGLSGMRTDSAGDGTLATVGSQAERLTLSAGVGLGRFSIDAYGTIGRRKFKPFVGPLGRLAVSGTGSEWSLGGSVAMSVPLAEHLSLSPYASIDVGSVETVRGLDLPSGPLTVSQRQKGTSGSAGVNLTRSFGPDDAHSFGANVAWSTSSNASASSAAGIGSRGARRTRALGQGATSGDSWFEYGVSASVQLGPVVSANFSATRTAGVLGGESTSVSGGLGFAF